jgi:hypothetical protein
VRTVREQRRVSSGRYQVSWDGRDEQGHLPPPGLYLVSVEIDTDTDGARLENARFLQTVSLVY